MADETMPPGEGNPAQDDSGDCRPDCDYEIGYGKPPLHSRFKKGQSGNPRGRPRRHHWKLATIFDAVLEEKVTIIEHGRRRQISKREAILRRFLNRALQGDGKATLIVTRLMSRGGDESELGLEPLTYVHIGADALP
jgi:hypothetical protein